MLKMFVATKKAGMCVGAPNVCFVPAPPPVNQVPAPMGSMGLMASADGVVDKVLVEHKETVVEGSKIPNSKTDELGTKGGVVSGVNSKEVTPKQFSSKVYFKGKKAFLHTGMSAHNGSNANFPAGIHSVPSQDKVSGGV
ncbi:MAG: PAAR-like domain-containing protein [Polyangiaceae bacterium]